MIVRRMAAAAIAVGALAGAPALPQTAPRFTYERRLEAGGAGPRRLAVDLALLSGAAPFRVIQRGGTAVADAGLSDLRLFDAAGTPVPYLLVHQQDAPVWRTGRLLPVAATKTTSGFEVDLGSARTVDRLRVEGLPAPFLKRLRLEGSGDRSRWTMLQSEGTLFDLPGESITNTEVPFPAGDYRYLRVLWNDANSGRVALPGRVLARDANVVSSSPQVAAELAFERRPSEPRLSRYRVALPAAQLPIVALELDAPGNVHRRVSVLESRLDGPEAVPVSLGSGTIVRVVRADAAAESMRIAIAAPAEAELELTIEDGDNPPLDLRRVAAVFADLPWIYFDAPSENLTAKYGDRSAAAPRYDLEAVRPSIDLARTPQAKWAGAAPASTSAAGELSSSAVSAGALLEGTFAYTRGIENVEGRGGLYALRLDPAALSRSRGPQSRFADVRIADPNNRQVPYLVERRSEPLVLEIATEPAASSDFPVPSINALRNRSFYRLILPEPNLPAGSLTLSTSAAVFQRSVQLGVIRPADRTRREARFEELFASTWRHGGEQGSASMLSLPVRTVDTAELWLVIDEGDNAALPLTGARLFLPLYRLRFFAPPNGALSLVYGRQDLAPPQYDLALLAARVMGGAATEVAAMPEGSSAERGTLISPRWFWVLLSVSVVVLLLIVVRLARAAP